MKLLNRARDGVSHRLRGFAATTLVLAATTVGALAAYGLTDGPPASAHPAARAATDPVLSITKTADRAFFSGAGEIIEYRYEVTNNNRTWPAFDVRVHDVRIGQVCDIGTLRAGGVTVCTAHHATTAADVSAGFIASNATVHGYDTPFPRGVSATSNPVTVRLIAPATPVTG